MNASRNHFAALGGFWRTLVERVSKRGAALSVALPASWLLSFYALVIHVRISLGRWPDFGEQLSGLLRFHQTAVYGLLVTLVISLYGAGAVFAICLMRAGTRLVSVYMFFYSAACGMALAALFLAPEPFLNWFLD